MNKPHSEMKRFFIGGTPELEDIRYVGQGDCQAGVLSKLGFQTRAGGSVKVRMDIIHQAKAFMLGTTRASDPLCGGKRRARRLLMDTLTALQPYSPASTTSYSGAHRLRGKWNLEE